jgi:subfamily B ATP-binding cassette protein MsbA
MKSYLRLLSLVKPYRRTLAFAFVCSAAYALFNAVAIWFSASFITAIFSPEAALSPGVPEGAAGLNESLKLFAWELIGGGDRFDVVQRAVVIFFLAFLLRNTFDVVQVYLITFIEQRVIKDLRDKLYGHMLSQSLAFFHRRKAGDLASITMNDVTALQEKMMKAIKFSMREPFVIGLFLFLLFTISWQLTLAALIVLPVAGVLIDTLGKSIKRKSARMQEALSGVTSLLYERLGGVRLIKTLGTEDQETAKFKDTTRTFFKKALRQRRFDILTVPLTEILGLAIISLILIYGGYLVFRTTAIDAEDFVRFIAITFSVLAPAKELGGAYTSIQAASAFAERIFKIMDAEEQLPVAKKPTPVSTLQEAIQFEGVSFRYDDTQDDALADVNLAVKQGETVALVGPSGAGKTTLIGLITRLFDPTRGNVILDGHDLRDIEIGGLRRLFGVVSQDIVLFNDTVTANIGYGADNIDKNRVIEAAKLAYADDFIKAMPQGYDTTIGDRGTLLSGGQQQRLSIARALVHDPPVIIFDEATSQLDSESESLIQQAMESLRENHTLIVIAHRLATVRRADRIVVLDQGRVIDQGSYDELLDRCDLFARLCQQQFLT